MTNLELKKLREIEETTTNNGLKDALHQVIERFREKTDAERLAEAEKELERLRKELDRARLDRFRSPNYPVPVPQIPSWPNDRFPERGPWENPIIWCSAVHEPFKGRIV